MFRLKFPNGRTVNCESAADLDAAIAAQLQTTRAACHFKAGFPPRPLLIGDTRELRGTTLLVEPRTSVHSPSNSVNAVSNSANTVSNSATTVSNSANTVSNSANTVSNAATTVEAEAEASTTEGCCRRVVVPADNSCLFACVAHSALGEHDAAAVRALAAAAIEHDSSRFTAAVLGRARSAYCAWLRTPTTWGGSLELDALSAALRCEFVVCAAARDARPLLVRHGTGHPRAAYLLFDGVHYDLLTFRTDALTLPHFSLPEHAALREQFERDALRLVKRLSDAGRLTDTSSFALRCLVCSRALRGQQEAIAHAQATGHANFAQNKETPQQQQGFVS